MIQIDFRNGAGLQLRPSRESQGGMMCYAVA